MGKGVEYIGSYAFMDAAVETIVLPISLKETGSSIFLTSKIEKIYIEADEIPEGWASDWCGKSSAELILGYGKD